MKFSLKFILPLSFILGAIAFLVVPLIDDLTLTWFKKDLDLRSQFISRSINIPLKALIQSNDKKKINELFEDFALDERLLAIGFCDSTDKLVYKTRNFPTAISCQKNYEEDPLVRLEEGSVHIFFYKIKDDAVVLGKLILIHDLSFVERRSKTTQQYVLILFLVLIVVVSFISIVIARISWRSLINEMKSLLKNDSKLGVLFSTTQRDLKPIAKDLRTMVRELERDRKIRDALNISWTPASLKELLNKELSGEEILILSNREPYIHNKNDDGSISVQTPASGLVTALEPIMRACSGTWIAHGSGSADKEVVDKNDCVRVPPLNPSYQIKRVWLSPEEEEGYYYGFSNEGLWPLCHIAHTRPTFRTSDWNYYVSVNQKFAAAVVAETKTDNPVILIQDYHFALAPKMIREALPNATIITFWHIPWPNAESFGICPWREEILEGLLGSSILGFHTRFHCINFFDSTERYLECRVDKDTSLISFQKKLTAVNAYPISIEWPPKELENISSIAECKRLICRKNNIPTNIRIGIGVDRLDYTKGILERFLAVERLFELYPDLIGQFSFIQIAAPSRTAIKEYRYLEQDVVALTDKINKKFSRENYLPIILLIEHHNASEVFEYFRAADVCYVSSLHDGMNLVAKEFIASRDDEIGVLILSQFTGAAKELEDALVVNPYDIDQCAHALAEGLNMSVSEQKERMRNMRGQIQEHNVYRWAAKMLIDGAKLRQREKIKSLTAKEG